MLSKTFVLFSLSCHHNKEHLLFARRLACCLCNISFGATLSIYVCSVSKLFVLLLLFSCIHFFLNMKDCGVYTICTLSLSRGTNNRRLSKSSRQFSHLVFYRDCVLRVFHSQGQLFYLCFKIPFDLWETNPKLSSLSSLGLL